jgi:CBS domain-containing protein
MHAFFRKPDDFASVWRRFPAPLKIGAVIRHRKTDLNTDFENFLRHLAAAPTPAALARLAGALNGLWLSGTQEQPAETAGQMVSDAADALTRRLLQLAMAELGPAPVAHAWIAYGSQGRRELTLNSDQDNALVLAEDYREEAHGPYFEQLAARVCHGLADCGFILCPGNMMASNPAWRLRSSDWRQHFHDWIVASDRHQARLAGNFFDLRCIDGDARLLAPLYDTMASLCPRHDSLLAHWVANANAAPPTLGLFRRFIVDEHGRLDLKHAAIIPLVELARIHSLSSGIVDTTSTLPRLQAAGGKRWLSSQGASELAASWCFLNELRVGQQRESLMRGRRPDNRIDTATLSPGTQEKLRESLQLIAIHQQALRQAYPHMPA